MNIISVAVGVIQNSEQQVLLAQRKADTHQAGKWEFAGGKIHPGETSRHALARELDEELGIQVTDAEPLIRIHHTYPEYQVILNVWRVLAYEGEVHGKENQAIQWVPISRLAEYDFPAANHPIVTAIRLPRDYVITPPGLNQHTILEFIDRIIKKGYKLIRFRSYDWGKKEYWQALPQVLELCRQTSTELIIDGFPELLQQSNAAGLHLMSRQLSHYQQRPIPKNKWLAVSCHNERELELAKKIDADFVMLSPVMPTPSHADAQVLGWPMFHKLVDKLAFPVYALGGMDKTSPAIWFGAQGIAGLRVYTQIVEQD